MIHRSTPRAGLTALVVFAACFAASAQAQVVLYRVNTGGADTHAADVTFPDWTEDQQEALDPPPILFAKKGINSPFVNADAAGDQTAGRNRASSIVFQSPVDPGVERTLFNTQRWDPIDPAQNMIWRFPVESERTYRIVLYFTELFGAGIGTRVFDVFAEGQLKIDNLDILASTGNLVEVAIVRSFEATDLDGDGAISVEFDGQTGTPIISAIEIQDLSSDNSVPTAVNPGNQVDDPGDPVSLQIDASDPDGGALTFGAEGLPPGLIISPDGLITGTPDPNTEGLYNVRVVAVDDGVPARGVFVSFQWVVGTTPPELVNPIADLTVLDTQEPTQIDLSKVFSDPAGLEIFYEIFENTNPEIVEATIDNEILHLTYFPGMRGMTTITVRAINTEGEFTDDVFSVDVDGGTPVALVQITPNSGLGASTFNPGMIVVTNQSEGTLRIQHVKIDITNALLPDMAFDPSGGAGDQGGKCLTPDSGAAETGFVEPDDLCRDPFSVALDGGYLVLEMDFADFDPGESFTFSVDVDPTSIKKARTVGESGAVSGIELAGSEVTARFTGGSTYANDLFRVGVGGLGGAEAVVQGDLLGPVTLRIAGTDASQAIFTEAAQTVLVEGPPGTTVRLLQLDAALNPEDSPDGGHDIDPFEANQGLAVLEYNVTIDADGVKEVPLNLRMSIPGNGLVGGLNYFIATAHTEGTEGRTSNPLVMELVSADNVIMAAGWNLVSLSFEVADNDYQAVYGPLDPLDAPYFWNGAYTQSSTLDVGRGYWLNLPAAGNVAIGGSEIEAVTLSLVEGWNLIGGPSCVIDEEAMGDSGSIYVPGTLYEYDGTYHNVTQVVQNRGYWMLSSGIGSVSLTCPAPGLAKTRTAAPVWPAPDGFGTVVVRDGDGRRQTLFFGGRLEEPTAKRSFSMPPYASQLAFDARFADDSRLAEGDEAVISIRTSRYPVELELTALPPTGEAYELQELVAGAVVATQPVMQGDVVVLSNEQVSAVRLRKAAALSDVLPEAFALRGNYPNPFNPTTTLLFDLPEAAEVTVGVFDLLGRQVLSIERQSIEAGVGRRLTIDGAALASGVYVYRLQADLPAGTQIAAGRMTLLK